MLGARDAVFVCGVVVIAFCEEWDGGDPLTPPPPWLCACLRWCVTLLPASPSLVALPLELVSLDCEWKLLTHTLIKLCLQSFVEKRVGRKRLAWDSENDSRSYILQECSQPSLCLLSPSGIIRE